MSSRDKELGFGNECWRGISRPEAAFNDDLPASNFLDAHCVLPIEKGKVASYTRSGLYIFSFLYVERGTGPFLRVEVRVGAQLNFIIGLEATRHREFGSPRQSQVYFLLFHKNEACQDAVRGCRWCLL